MWDEMMMRNLSMGEYLLRRYRERQPLLPLRAENADELRQWQVQFRAKVWEGLGLLPEQKCPLEPIIVDRGTNRHAVMGSVYEAVFHQPR